MLKIPSSHVLPLAVALALGASAAMAESTAQGTTSQAPATLGVTPQDAQEALHNASPRADTATWVRTGESTEKRARDTAKDAKPLPPGKAKTPTTDQPQRANTAPPPADVKSNTTTGTVTNTTTPSAAMGITGTVPGADDTTGDVTNTRDNAHKGPGKASGAAATRSMDAMGNRTSTPKKP